MIQNLANKPERYWYARALSFTYAFAGIVRFFRTEPNARIHLLATLGVIALSFIYSITAIEAIMLLLTIGSVWAAEIFNTCIEKTMDFISTETHPQIRCIKDMSAGAVLVAAITAAVIGSIIFIPKIIDSKLFQP